MKVIPQTCTEGGSEGEGATRAQPDGVDSNSNDDPSTEDDDSDSPVRRSEFR
eukprot:CAMPEP_0205936598 /NCGR_PEP_ID=MMETSP1325-20131115/41993_1 /ASSEMBLY_ACC=CAM_ASM_000708 /TAXON_ID=236786 /ORGANISM="Florenciella sp., Strain RCC1007" /LENGTH=51 /DNA_ID=CAMNT_0053306775 /DNA_START=129 /DNA_END=280 /DNA_ORIENTATION=-